MHRLQWSQYVSRIRRCNETCKDEKIFDEDEFMQRLDKMTDSKISELVKHCEDHKTSAFKIVRSLQKVIRKTKSSKHKLTLFYVHHELGIVMARGKNIDFNKRLAKSILSFLPIVKEYIPQDKLERCLRIWQRCHIFEKNIIANLCEMIHSKSAFKDDHVKKSHPRVHVSDLPQKVLTTELSEHVKDDELDAEFPAAENVPLRKPPHPSSPCELAVDMKSQASTSDSMSQASTIICSICDMNFVTENDFLNHLAASHYKYDVMKKYQKFGSKCPFCGEETSDNINHIAIEHKAVLKFYKKDKFALTYTSQEMRMKEIIKRDCCITISSDSDDN